MKKIFLIVLLFSFAYLCAEDVVRLEGPAGAESEYAVADLLHVELIGDSIRFIGMNGSVVAEVYKYDYIRLTVGDNQPAELETQQVAGQNVMAQKVLINGQVYILFGDKVYSIQGIQVK